MIDWELILIAGGGYLVFFWLLPMCGIQSDSEAKRRWPNLYEAGELIPYWKAVRQVSAVFHVAVIIVAALSYFWLIPALTVTP